MANYSKTIICFANSRKNSGRCIAGRELESGNIGEWIRPVSSRQNAELSEDDRRFKDGKDPKVLDIIRIEMKRQKDHAFQSENHLIDDGYYWSFQGRASWDQVMASVDDSGEPLWSNESSSYNGKNDRVDENEANPEHGSLKLIKVDDLNIHVSVEGAAFGNGKRKVRGDFTYGEINYRLTVTDPLIERKYLNGSDGTSHVGSALLCVSLGEPYNGWAYKLIAAVILQ